MSLLEVKDLCIQYKTDSDVVSAVNGVSFSVDAGEVLGLVGETGAGKTTTALGLMRLIPNPPGKIVSGEIGYHGEDLLGKSEREMRNIRGNEISMIFQDPMTALNPVIPIDEQIAEVVRHHRKCSKKEAEAVAIEMLEKVGIQAVRAHEYPHQFSGGMKQRVVIAIALACSPETQARIDRKVTEMVDTQYQKAMDLLKTNEEKLHQLAQYLYEHETITGREFMEILEGQREV